MRVHECLQRPLEPQCTGKLSFQSQVAWPGKGTKWPAYFRRRLHGNKAYTRVASFGISNLKRPTARALFAVLRGTATFSEASVATVDDSHRGENPLRVPLIPHWTESSRARARWEREIGEREGKRGKNRARLAGWIKCLRRTAEEEKSEGRA